MTEREHLKSHFWEQIDCSTHIPILLYYPTVWSWDTTDREDVRNRLTPLLRSHCIDSFQSNVHVQTTGRTERLAFEVMRSTNLSNVTSDQMKFKRLLQRFQTGPQPCQWLREGCTQAQQSFDLNANASMHNIYRVHHLCSARYHLLISI